jgi:quinolinate synthase
VTAPFPSLMIRAGGFEARGAFAEAQATYLQPDPETVADLDAALAAAKIGVVAHFYMDAELQGVLSACQWPHIFISDSLAMADAAVRMAEAGAEAVVVLGVDFMSENVRAVMDYAGHDALPVYRLSDREIGCSLAESAQALAYGAWLTRARESINPLHVIYINTGLDVKARSHVLVPTITCTSSNVLKTLLQAYAQVPDLHVFYGPDTYMGRNLEVLFRRLADRPDEEIAALHPGHDRASVRSLLERFDYFKQGSCVVHHMFGAEVVRQVRQDYADCFHTAHLEVPGEMFALAAEAQRSDRGVVGSTSDILQFIVRKLEEALGADAPGTLRFVLGTEAGMVTAIVNAVRGRLRASGREDIGVEIIFPVAAEAVAQAPESGLGIIPGVAGGEGCSTAGGCATCPYMKMNSLEALFDVVEAAGRGEALAGFEPRKYSESLGGRSVAEVGTEPILHMRHFQATGQLSDVLVAQVTGTTAAE